MERLSHYYLLDLLGSGSSASVYRAQDSRQGRTVALKVLKPKGERTAQQFRRELEVSRSLRHEAIVPIESLETLDDGRLLLVMPYVAGRTLDKVLVPVSVQKALSVARQVAAGLAHAHAKGILHCDIKPANLVLVDGQVCILDFGLASFAGEVAQTYLGTLEYRSPEVARGQAATVQSDLWALGVVLYELLTGVSPFRGDDEVATLRRIAAHHPVPVSSVRPDLTASLDALVSRLLAKRPDERYASAHDLTRALSEVLHAPGPSTTSAVKTTANTPTLTPSALVGRDSERALVSLYLQDPSCRLLSLHGMGGVGKTVLARAALKDQAGLGRFAELRFVPLVSSTDLLADLGQALDIETALPPAEGLALRLQAPTLLVLDNVEHLSRQADGLEVLLARCPELKLLVTSRERLKLGSEWVLPLRGLSYPKEGDAPLTFPAAELFLREAGSALEPQRDALEVLSIIRRLRGHPLGLKLVASWLKHMSAPDAVERLSTLDASLRPLFEQSFALLAPRQQRLFAHLGVFAGGFTLEAAERVLGSDEAALLGLLDAALLGRSVEGRYEQHPLTKAFADMRFAQADDKKSVRARFSRYYLDLLRGWDGDLLGGKQAEVMRRLEQEYDNVVSALRLTPGESRPETAEPLRVFYTQKGRYAEGYALFEARSGNYAEVCRGWFALLRGETELAATVVAELGEVVDARTRLLSTNLRAGLAWQQGDTEQGEALSLAALELAAELSDIPAITAVRSNLGLLSETLGRPKDAAEHYQASLSLAETSGNKGMTLLNLNNLAALYIAQARFDEARPLLAKGLLLSEKSKLERLKPFLQSNLGLCLYAERDFDNAQQAYQEAASVLEQRGQLGAAATVEGYLAQVYRAKGEPKRARDLLVAALAKARQAGDEQSCLSILVRFAELLASTDAQEASALAALVAAHPQSDAGDRKLAQTLNDYNVPVPNLDEVVEQLLVKN